MIDKLKVKNGATIMLIGTLVLGTISGTIIENKRNREVKEIEGQEQIIDHGEKRIFEPGEHVLMVRYSPDNKRIDNHEGYEITDITALSSRSIIVVYTNVEAVECIATTTGFNENDFIAFGTPVESTLEKQI
jgi:hypothetical protein